MVEVKYLCYFYCYWRDEKQGFVPTRQAPMGLDIMDQRHRWMVHGKLEKKALLVAINSLAGLSIFFFGKVAQNLLTEGWSRWKD